MAENQIPFETSLQDDGLTVGVDSIIEALQRLDSLTTSVADTLTGGLTRVEQAFSSMGTVATDVASRIETGFRSVGDVISQIAGSIGGSFSNVASTTTTVADAFARLEGVANSVASSFASLSATGIDVTDSLARIETSLAGVGTSSADTASQLGTTNMVLGDIRASSQQAADGIDTLTRQMRGLLDNTSAMVSAIGRGNAILADIRTAGQNAAAGIGQLVTTMGDLLSVTRSMDSSLFDAVNVLGDIRTAAESSATMLGELSAKMDILIASMRDVAAAGASAGSGLADLGDKSLLANARIRGMSGGVGDFLIMMGGFTILNDAIRGLQNFGDAAIYGNATIERLRITLKAFGYDGQSIIDWSFKFGRTIPDTTTNLQAAIMTIGSLGLNIQEVVPALATVAGYMGETLPRAAQAFLDAFTQHRFLMMQRGLRVSKEELQAFGLDLQNIPGTLPGAFEAFARYKFPEGLAPLMHTFSGETSNLIDQMQQLGMAFGKPIFDMFEQALFGIITFINANHDAIWNFAQDVGTVLGGAVGIVTTALGQFILFLQQNKVALLALGVVITAVLVGLLWPAIAAIGGVVGGLIGFSGAAAGVTAAIGAVLGPLVALIGSSEPLRSALAGLWQAATDLATVVGQTLGAALASIKSPFDGLSGALDTLFGRFVHISPAQIMGFAGQAIGLGNAFNTAAGQIKGLGDQVVYVSGPLTGVVDAIKYLTGGLQGIANAIKAGDFSGFTNALGIVVPLLASFNWAVLAGVGAFAKFGIGADSLGKFVMVLRDGVLAVVGPLDRFFGALVKIDFLPALGSAFASLAGFVGDLGSAFAFLGAGGVLDAVSGGLLAVAGAAGALLAPLIPIIVIVVAVAAAIGGLVYGLIHWWQTNEGFRKSISELLGDIGALGGILMGSLRQAWDQIQKSLADLKPTWDLLVQDFKLLEPVLLLIGGLLLGFFLTALGVAFAVLKGVLMALGPLIAGTVQAITGVLQIVVGVISLVVNLIVNGFKVLRDIFTGDGKNLAKDWDALWRGLLGSLGQIWSGIVNLVLGVLGGLWGAIVGLVTGIVTGIIDWFRHLADTLVGHSIIPDMVNAILAWFGQLVARVLAFITGLIATVLGAVLRWRDMFLQFIADLVLGTLLKLGTLAIQGLLLIDTLVKMVLALVLSWRDRFLAFIEQLVIGTLDKLRNMALRAIDHVGLMVILILDRIEFWKNMIIAKVIQMVNEFIAQLAGWVTKALGKAVDLITSLGKEIGSWPAKMGQWALDMVNRFIGEFGQLAGKALKIAQDTAGNIASLLHHSKPDRGPMADDDKWMPDFVDTLVGGLNAGTPRLVDSATRAALAMRGVLSQIGGPGGGTTGAGGSTSSNVTPFGAQAGRGTQFLGTSTTGAGGPTTVTVTMPDSFQAGFSMIDPAIRAQLVAELRDELGKQMGGQTRLQGHYNDGYSGYTR